MEGVTKDKNSWRARARIKTKQTHVGQFITEEEAIVALKLFKQKKNKEQKKKVEVSPELIKARNERYKLVGEKMARAEHDMNRLFESARSNGWTELDNIHPQLQILRVEKK